MGLRKPRFTIEKHQEIGRRLYKLIEDYAHLRTEIANAFPINTPVVKEANKARNHYRELRNQLEKEFYKLEGTNKLKPPY